MVDVLSESGAVVVGGEITQRWPHPDPDMADLMRQPEYYAAYLAAQRESVHDAMTLEEAEQWFAEEPHCRNCVGWGCNWCMG